MHLCTLHGTLHRHQTKAAYAFMALSGQGFCGSAYDGLLLNMKHGAKYSYPVCIGGRDISNEWRPGTGNSVHSDRQSHSDRSWHRTAPCKREICPRAWCSWSPFECRCNRRRICNRSPAALQGKTVRCATFIAFVCVSVLCAPEPLT